MKVVLINGNTFVEVVSNFEFEDFNIEHSKVLGVLLFEEAIGQESINNLSKYIVTLIHDRGGIHEFLIYNDGLSLKSEYDELIKLTNDHVMIFNFENLLDYSSELLNR